MAIWPPLACGYTKKTKQYDTEHRDGSNEPVYRVERGTGRSRFSLTVYILEVA